MKSQFWLAVVLLFPCALEAQNRISLIENILEESSWKLTTDPLEFTEDVIEDLVARKGSTVRHYGLTGASLLNFEGPDGRVEATLYEMIDSTASYGLFTSERKWNKGGFESFPVGAESFRVGNTLAIWQSNYVIRLVGPSPAIENLALIISTRILGRSAKPPVSYHLPRKDLVNGSEQYILDPATFQNSTGLDPDHFGFDNSVEISVAEYNTNGVSAILIMLLYPTQQLAKQHADLWLSATAGIAPHKRSGPLLAIVQKTTNPDVLESILSAVHYESQVTWTESLPDPLTLPHLILTVFSWIGVGLVLTTIAGIGFGGLRIYLKTKYPGRGFDGNQAIQLNIDQPVTRRQLNE